MYVLVFTLTIHFYAFRQKLTSPKWNRFRGIRLRWKDKIRLNNLIWRCWHLQCKVHLGLFLFFIYYFVLVIKKENTLICQFASPLDVDTHNKPEVFRWRGGELLLLSFFFLSTGYCIRREVLEKEIGRCYCRI